MHFDKKESAQDHDKIGPRSREILGQNSIINQKQKRMRPIKVVFQVKQKTEHVKNTKYKNKTKK